MKYTIAIIVFLSMVLLPSCSKQKSTAPTTAGAEQPKGDGAGTAPVEAATGPRASVLLKNGTRVAGVVVASSNTDLVVAGEDGIEHKIPLAQVKSVEYSDTATTQSGGAPMAVPNRAAAPPKTSLAATRSETETNRPDRPAAQTQQRAEPTAPAPVARPAVTTRTFELPSGSEVSVRVNEPIDSESAREGQTYDAQVTRDTKDANNDVVIPRGSDARVVIRSASNGGRFRGASDLVLDLESVTINGKRHAVDTVDVTRHGKSGIGANKRTAEYTGGGAAVGAVIGAIAGGGRGAAIGAAAGAGAGALTQILTKGRAIKVPAESVLTFSLDRPLKVVRVE